MHTRPGRVNIVQPLQKVANALDKLLLEFQVQEFAFV
jgi:hypothetical protein